MIDDPSGQYFTAFSTRLVSTCSTRAVIGDRRRRPRRDRAVTDRRFCSMRSRKFPITWCAIGPTSTASARGLNSFDSMRDRSSTSSTSSCRRRALRSIISTKRTDASGSCQRRPAQRLGRRRHRRDRRAQLVRHVGDEVAAQRLQAAHVGDVDEDRQQPRLPRHRLGVHQRAARLEADDLDLARVRALATPAPSPAAAAARRCGSPRSRSARPSRSTAPASRAATG